LPSVDHFVRHPLDSQGGREKRTPRKKKREEAVPMTDNCFFAQSLQNLSGGEGRRGKKKKRKGGGTDKLLKRMATCKPSLVFAAKGDGKKGEKELLERKKGKKKKKEFIRPQVWKHGRSQKQTEKGKKKGKTRNFR